MIDRQSCYNALFKLKKAGIDVEKQINIMKSSDGVPRDVILFLRDNSPQFQFYRYIQKRQKALAQNLLDFDSLKNEDKLIVGSSFITRVYLAIKYKDFSQDLVDDLNISELTKAVDLAVSQSDFSQLNQVLSFHRDALKLFYKVRS